MKGFVVKGNHNDPDCIVELLEVNGVDVTDEYIYDKTKSIPKGTEIHCKTNHEFTVVKIKQGIIKPF